MPPRAVATFAAAIEAGATATMPLADMFWGDRYGKLVDPFGHHWAVAEHVEDPTPEQMREIAAQAEREQPGVIDQLGGFAARNPQLVKMLGGAAMVMFGAVAAAGINILASIHLDRRALLIIAVSLALGLGVSQVPEFLAHMPAALRNVLESGVATGGICAVLMNWFLPAAGQDSADSPDSGHKQA